MAIMFDSPNTFFFMFYFIKLFPGCFSGLLITLESETGLSYSYGLIIFLQYISNHNTLMARVS